MNQALSKVFQSSALISRAALILVILLVASLNALADDLSNSTQIIIAIIALAVGIPHGAIDHLITIPQTSKSRFYLFILGYTLIAVIAGLAIANWSQAGFQLVILMSSLHFGFGDAAFCNEGRIARQEQPYKLTTLGIYAVPAGFLPVILPLTDSRTGDVLSKLNPELLDWAGSISQQLRNTVLISAVASFVFLIISKKFDLAFDLVLLALLSIVAPPLIAFAIYFGGWHAVRHTARLVPKLPKAMSFVNTGNTLKAIIAAVTPGLYAILGIFLLGGVIVFNGNNQLSYEFFWITLVIVWALTVPHMATTARFDLAAFNLRPRP